MNEKKTSVKKRNWVFVLYPESAPIDWKLQLQLSGVQAVISPLHNMDVDPTGEKKKAHYHIILVYGSPTTYSNVKSFTDKLNQPIPQALEQVRGYYRYLTHKDNPEKYQYDEKNIVAINGFNIADFVEITKSEIVEIKFKLQSLIRDKNICEYEILMDYVQDNFDKITYDIASSHTIFFNSYLRSRRHKQEQPTKVKLVDRETGEIME